MLSPKRTSYRKPYRGNRKGRASRRNAISFGEYGLQATQPAWITSRQIEASRRVLTRYVRRTGKLWIRIFPDVPVSSKPAEVRMGKGKGTPEFWVARVKPGRIMFEIDGVSWDLAREAFTLAAAKLPLDTRIVRRLGDVD